MAQFDLLLLVKADSPIKTLKDALDAARVDPERSPASTAKVLGGC
jgi:hypothetical protein